MRKDGTTAKVVSFSGIDGAGKSTQIRALCARAQDIGLRVRLVTFWDEVARFRNLREGVGHTVFKGDKGVGTPSAPVNRRDKNVQSLPMTLFRLGLYFIDALSTRRVYRKLQASGVECVVFDRYIYDELANLPLRSRAIRMFIRFIMVFVPKPDVSFILDASPAEARARKPEYPLEFLVLNRRAYLRLSELLGGMTVITPMQVDEVTRLVLGRTFEVLAIRHSRADTLQPGAEQETRMGQQTTPAAM